MIFSVLHALQRYHFKETTESQISRKFPCKRFENNWYASGSGKRLVKFSLLKESQRSNFFQGQQDLQEVVELWAANHHVLHKHFRENIVAKPKDFMSKFLSGQE